MAQGDAFVWRLPQEALLRPGGPTDADLSWAWLDSAWTSVKAVRVGDAAGNAIVLVHREAAGGQMEAGLAMLRHDTGAQLWGPTAYPQQTEGTDIAVAPDASGFVITGHGSTAAATSSAAYYGRLTRVGPRGNYLWTRTLASNPNASIIYNECWGVQPYGWDEGVDGWVLSCGTGIEGTATCADSRLTAAERAWCAQGAPSAWGGAARMPGVWSNMIAAFTDSTTPAAPGAILWSAVNSYISTEAGATSQSSASEFISPCASGGFYVTTDEVFGVGLMRIGAPALTP